MDLRHHPPHQALDLRQARPPTAWLRPTSRPPPRLPSRGPPPPRTPGRPTLRLLTPRPPTRLIPHLTITLLYSPDTRDIQDTTTTHLLLLATTILLLLPSRDILRTATKAAPRLATPTD